MALADNDLLIVQKPATKVHYKIKVSDLPTGTTIPDGTNSGDTLIWTGSQWQAGPPASSIPDGTNAGDYLVWSGTQWNPSDTIDGGTY